MTKIASLLLSSVLLFTVACNGTTEAKAKNDLKVSGLRDPSVKPLPVVPAGGVRDPSIQPAPAGGVRDPSVRPAGTDPPVPAK